MAEVKEGQVWRFRYPDHKAFDLCVVRLNASRTVAEWEFVAGPREEHPHAPNPAMQTALLLEHGRLVSASPGSSEGTKP